MKLAHAFVVAALAAAVAVPVALAVPDPDGASDSSSAAYEPFVTDFPATPAPANPTATRAPTPADASGGVDWSTVAITAGIGALALVAVGSLVVRHSLTRHPPAGPPTVAAQ